MGTMRKILSIVGLLMVAVLLQQVEVLPEPVGRLTDSNGNQFLIFNEELTAAQVKLVSRQIKLPYIGVDGNRYVMWLVPEEATFCAQYDRVYQ